MDEQALRELIGQVKRGQLSRRQLHTDDGGPRPDRTHGRRHARVGRRGDGPACAAAPTAVEARGRRRPPILMWDAPDAAPPAFRARPSGPHRLPPLLRAARRARRPEGTFAPVLASEIPSLKNGGLSKDGTVGHLAAQEERRLARRRALHGGRRDLQLAVRHRSRQRHQHDAPASTKCARVEKIDSHSVKVVYKKPQPFWQVVFTGDGLLPRHVFEPLERRRRAGFGRHGQAGRDRALQAGRVQAGRPDPRRDQPDLPRPEPPLLRPPRGQVRRGLGRHDARRAADGRVRLRLLRPRGGRSAAPHRAGRQGPRADAALRAA